MRLIYLLLAVAAIIDGFTLTSAKHPTPSAVRNWERAEVSPLTKRGNGIELPDLNLPAEGWDESTPAPSVATKPTIPCQQWSRSKYRIIREAAPDEEGDLQKHKSLYSLSVMEKYILSKGAREVIEPIPFDDLAIRAHTVRKFYLDHGIFLSAKQIYMFFINHQLLPHIPGCQSYKRKAARKLKLDVYDGRKRVELLHHGLMKYFQEHPEYTRAQLQDKTIETYEKNGVEGNLRNKARLFLHRYFHAGRFQKPREVKAKSRVAMVVEVKELLKQLPLDDYWGRRELIDKYYRDNGSPMSKKFLREFCYRHNLIPRIRPPNNYNNNRLECWTQRADKRRQVCLNKIKQRHLDSRADPAIHETQGIRAAPIAEAIPTSDGSDLAPPTPWPSVANPARYPSTRASGLDALLSAVEYEERRKAASSP